MKIPKEYTGNMVISVFKLESGMCCAYEFNSQKDYETIGKLREEMLEKRGEKKITVYTGVNDKFYEQLKTKLEKTKRNQITNEQELTDLLTIKK